MLTRISASTSSVVYQKRKLPLNQFCACTKVALLFTDQNNTACARVQFEQPEVRELKMILDGQNEIYRSLKTLLVKLDEVVGRQERELSLLTMINQHQTQAQPQPSPSDQLQVVILSVSYTHLTLPTIYSV